MPIYKCSSCGDVFIREGGKACPCGSGDLVDLDAENKELKAQLAGAPRPNVAEFAETLHAKWQELATWTRPTAFDDLSDGEQCRWLELTRWLLQRFVIKGGKDQ
jgi:hypothetical protein